MNADGNGKKCTKCGAFKELKDFTKCKANSDGHKNLCKTCTRQYQKQHYKENSDYYKNKRKEHYLEKTEEVKQRQRQYYQENSDYYKEYRKKRYQELRDLELNYANEYRVKNQYKILKYRRSEKGRQMILNNTIKRRSRKYKVDFTPFQRKKLLDRDNWKCQSCGCKVHDRHTGNWNTPDKAHIDHIIPITKGGNSDPSNLRVLCRTCNISKSNRIEEQMKLDI